MIRLSLILLASLQATPLLAQEESATSAESAAKVAGAAAVLIDTGESQRPPTDLVIAPAAPTSDEEADEPKPAPFPSGPTRGLIPEDQVKLPDLSGVPGMHEPMLALTQTQDWHSEPARLDLASLPDLRVVFEEAMLGTVAIVGGIALLVRHIVRTRRRRFRASA